MRWCYARLSPDEWVLGRGGAESGGGQVAVQVLSPSAHTDDSELVLCAEGDIVYLTDEAAESTRTPQDDLLKLSAPHEAAIVHWLHWRFVQGYRHTFLGRVLINVSDGASAGGGGAVAGIVERHASELALGYLTSPAFVPLGCGGSAAPMGDEYLTEALRRFGTVQPELVAKAEAARAVLRCFLAARERDSLSLHATARWDLGLNCSGELSAVSLAVSAPELSRACGGGARVFQPFYCLLAGPDAERFLLRGGAGAYPRLFGGGSESRPSMPTRADSDATDYRRCCSALEELGLAPEHVWRAVAGIAHLCEVGFDEAGEQSARSVASTRLAAGLLGLDGDRLRSALTASGSGEEAATQRDAACRWCYAALLRHVFDRVCAVLKEASQQLDVSESVLIVCAPGFSPEPGLWSLLQNAQADALECRFWASEHDAVRMRELAERRSGPQRVAAADRASLSAGCKDEPRSAEHVARVWGPGGVLQRLVEEERGAQPPSMDGAEVFAQHCSGRVRYAESLQALAASAQPPAQGLRMVLQRAALPTVRGTPQCVVTPVIEAREQLLLLLKALERRQVSWARAIDASSVPHIGTAPVGLGAAILRQARTFGCSWLVAQSRHMHDEAVPHSVFLRRCSPAAPGGVPERRGRQAAARLLHRLQCSIDVPAPPDSVGSTSVLLHGPSLRLAVSAAMHSGANTLLRFAKSAMAARITWRRAAAAGISWRQPVDRFRSDRHTAPLPAARRESAPRQLVLSTPQRQRSLVSVRSARSESNCGLTTDGEKTPAEALQAAEGRKRRGLLNSEDRDRREIKAVYFRESRVVRGEEAAKALREQTARVYPTAATLARKVASRIDRHQLAIADMVERSRTADTASLCGSELDRRVAAVTRRDHEEHAARMRAEGAALGRERKRDAARLARVDALKQRQAECRERLRQSGMQRDAKARAEQARAADKRDEYEWEDAERKLLQSLEKQLGAERRIEREKETLRKALERDAVAVDMRRLSRRQEAVRRREEARREAEQKVQEQARRKEELKQWKETQRSRHEEEQRQKDVKRLEKVQWERRRRARMALEATAWRTAAAATSTVRGTTAGAGSPRSAVSYRSSTCCASSLFASPQRDGEWVPLAHRMGLHHTTMMQRGRREGSQSQSRARSQSATVRSFSADPVPRSSSPGPRSTSPIRVSQGSPPHRGRGATPDGWECGDCHFWNDSGAGVCEVCQAGQAHQG